MLAALARSDFGASVFLKEVAIFTKLFISYFRQVEDLEILTHTNETLGSVRRQLLQKLKGNPANVKLELFLNGDPIDPIEDRKILAHLPIKDKSLLSAKITPVGGAGGQVPASSPDSSSDSSSGSPQHGYNASEGGHNGGAAVPGGGGPNVEIERSLPGTRL